MRLYPGTSSMSQCVSITNFARSSVSALPIHEKPFEATGRPTRRVLLPVASKVDSPGYTTKEADTTNQF